MNTIPIEKEELIVRLLVEDYRFQQIIHRMSQINFHFDQSLDLMSIVAELMHSEQQEPDLLWLHAYAEGLEQAYETEFWNNEELQVIAVAAFQRLSA